MRRSKPRRPADFADFSEQGEAGFREIEAEVLRNHVRKSKTGQPCVLALGGGAFVQPAQSRTACEQWHHLVARLSAGSDSAAFEWRHVAASGGQANGLGRLYEDRGQSYSRADYRSK